ncbi:MAG: PD-(D/E)XK nuclease family transposase [Candidatus Gracilibacteria bacterium]|nr:PD-(D/E)XK nuclease family transposase [Candidatus Gracilibacteria bacterium]
MSFLNAILDFKGDKEIKEVEILDPYQAPKIKGLKDTYLDLKVKTEEGKV